MRDHQGEEVARELGEARSPRDLRGQIPLLRHRNPRPGKEVAQIPVALEGRRHLAELAADELGEVALFGEGEQRLRVRRGRQWVLHRRDRRSSGFGTGRLDCVVATPVMAASVGLGVSRPCRSPPVA
jgi:hypothetical protein